jgi:hypothetical protein
LALTADARPEDAMGLWDRTKHGSVTVSTETRTRANRRSTDRKRQRLIDGFVWSGSIPKRPCTVLDMSETGIRIELWAGDTAPLQPGDHVTILIPSDGIEVDAEVRWRQGTIIGMRFTSVFRFRRRHSG